MSSSKKAAGDFKNSIISFFQRVSSGFFPFWKHAPNQSSSFSGAIFVNVMPDIVCEDRFKPNQAPQQTQDVLTSMSRYGRE